jgi:hypothetical protein
MLIKFECAGADSQTKKFYFFVVYYKNKALVDKSGVEEG